MEMEYFLNKNGAVIIHNMIIEIQKNKDYLSEVDGAAGDGDHGVNMNKGFTLCRDRIGDRRIDLATALNQLGMVLLMEIGGSMGPLYGTFFIEMSKEAAGKEKIDKYVFGDILKAGLKGVQALSEASVGDKTLLDTLIPGVDAYFNALSEGKNYSEILKVMKEAAENGKESTRDMIAKIGRASRLGERSRGSLDAGAASCNVILQSMANTIIDILS